MYDWNVDKEVEKKKEELLDNAFFAGYFFGCIFSGIVFLLGKLVGIV